MSAPPGQDLNIMFTKFNCRWCSHKCCSLSFLFLSRHATTLKHILPRHGDEGVKALKAMKVKKAMKAMKKISARAAKLRVFKGKLGKTASGLKADDFTTNKRGNFVSNKQRAAGKRNPWMLAVVAARKAHGIKGPAMLKKGSPLYAKIKAQIKALMGKK